jgi:phosphopantetheine--protein transferase-like protein
MDEASKIVVTGTGAVCGAGTSPEDILDAVVAGRSAIAPITQWDTAGWPCRTAAEIPDFNPRAMVDDRKLHKLIRRTDLVGLYAAGRAIERSGVVAHRNDLDPDAAAAYSDRTGVYVGSGGGNYENQYDYFPLLAETHDDMPAFGRELANTVNPMWLLRTLPNNVLGHIGIRHGLKGSNACITNHSVGGSLALIEAVEALRNGEADRVVAVGHETPIEPQMVLYYHAMGLLASESLRPFDARHDGSLFGEGAGAMILETQASAAARNAPALGEVLGGGYVCEAQGLAAIRDDGDGSRQGHFAGTRRREARVRRRRHDRRARQRHAAIRRLRSGRDSSRVRRRIAARHRIQVGDRSHHRRRRNPRSGARARRARAQRRARRGEPRHARPALRGIERCLVLASAAQQRRARPLSRLRRAPTRRSSSARRSALALAKSVADAPVPAPAGLCGIDTVEIARIERLLDETPAADLANVFSAAELADSGEGPGRAASLAARFAAKEACVKLFPREAALGTVGLEDFSITARQLRRAARRLQPAGRCGARPASHRLDRRFALARSRERIRRRAGAARRPRGLAAGPPLLSIPPHPPCGDPREPAARVRRLRFRSGDRRARAGALRASVRLMCEFVVFRWLSAERQAVARARRELRGVRRGARPRQRRADPDGPLRQLGGEHHRGAGEVSIVPRQVPFRSPCVQAALAGRVDHAPLQRSRIRRHRQARLARPDPRSARQRRCDRLSVRSARRASDGIESEFFGHPAWTFRSLAIIALATGAPVVSATGWRDADGTHVMQFGEPLPPVEADDTNEAIRLTTRAYNVALERLVLRASRAVVLGAPAVEGLVGEATRRRSGYANERKAVRANFAEHFSGFDLAAFLRFRPSRRPARPRGTAASAAARRVPRTPAGRRAFLAR